MHRSYLYVPGDRPDRLDKALASGADAVIVDLEDGVAPAARGAARAEVAAALGRLAPARDGSPEVLVRVNNDADLAHDVDAVLGAGGRSLYLPKADEAAVDRLVGLTAGEAVTVVALVETARGVLDAPAVAAHPMVRNLAIGEADLVSDLGMHPSADRRELIGVRTSLVVASAAAGAEAPTGPVSTDFSDLGALRSETDALRRMGFGARAAIHPAQVPVINEVFTPSEAEVAEATRLVRLHEAHLEQGRGAFTDDDGTMVDEAVVRSAKDVLSRARRT